ncbi:trehalose-phosphatase [Dyella subtropica]|uniref:trehalose-phosphatase n=1 Tax=Dyella subtropica TaxID=2992127 RepID=UPI002251D697|nr:trehalose-phosphatase [Dyella subtropica]
MSVTPLPAPPLPGTEDRWALFLDVDGTLLEFADRPDEVRVEPSLYALLAELYAVLDGALALVSGRSMNSLDALFGTPPWAMAGLHGLQLRHANGEQRETRVSASRRTLVLHTAETLARAFPGVLVENKDLTVALHTRGVPDQFDALKAAVKHLLPELHGYELQVGSQVLELKPVGMDKGKALAELLERAPFAGRLPVYLGDDLTDEYGFAATNLENGISVRVGEGREPSLAQYSLPGPSSAQAWLFRVLNVLKQGVHPHAYPFGGDA